jgi:hypothetical protein
MEFDQRRLTPASPETLAQLSELTNRMETRNSSRLDVDFRFFMTYHCQLQNLKLVTKKELT